MTSRVLFILIAAFAMLSEQGFMSVSGDSINEPLIACALVLILSPWLLRQFE